MNVMRQTLQALAAEAERSANPADPWRLGVHLMPPAGWLNDPNGLCYFRGMYHVFYQYNPFSAQCGLKFWGHYRSPDLLSWERCPVMLCPDQTFDIHGAYSGSAFCGEDGMYLYYTGNVKHEGEGCDYVRTGRENNTILAYSPDGLRLGWKRLLLRNEDYPAGLTLHVRDPKVWKQEGRYYMIQGARTQEDTGAALIFESEDRLHWTHVNTLRTAEPFGYMWECPDLFEIGGQWVLLASPQGVERTGPGFENQYACGYFPLRGDFRGAYTLGEFVPLDYGFDFYAPQTFSDGKRRLLIGWMGMPDADYENPTAAAGWQHCLTVPRELRWENGRLRMRPVRELDSLREEARMVAFSGRETVSVSPICDIQVECEGGRLSLDLSGVRVRAEDGVLTLAIQDGGWGRSVRRAPVGELRSVRVLADTSALEIFVNGGETVLSVRWYPEGESRTLTLEGEGRAAVCRLRPMEVRAAGLA